MAKILVSGLANIETTVGIDQFPIEYSPIDYKFFGIQSSVSGVAYNVCKALTTLGDEVSFITLLGKDSDGEHVTNEFIQTGIETKYIQYKLKETPSSVVLYDQDGQRKIYCDLKDIQEQSLDFHYAKDLLEQCDLVVACNCNFNRNLLKLAKSMGKTIATDVHVLNDIHDFYNKEFMEYADILFLSNELLTTDPKEFIQSIEDEYHNSVIVLGQGKDGALMYVREENQFYDLKAKKVKHVINTVGAGDALFSSFIHYYLKHQTAEQSLEMAQVFAAYKIGFIGASVGFADEDKMKELMKESEDEIEN